MSDRWTLHLAPKISSGRSSCLLYPIPLKEPSLCNSRAISNDVGGIHSWPITQYEIKKCAKLYALNTERI